MDQRIVPAVILPTEDNEKINMGQELPLKGGLNFDLPIGTLYSKNITPDDETGIGKLPDSGNCTFTQIWCCPGWKSLCLILCPFHNLK
jgi:hypothetical protein